MAEQFLFPDVGEGIHEGRVVEWLVKVGDRVRTDQPMVRVETDKAVVELPAPMPGRVATLHVPPGGEVRVGDPLVTFELASGKTLPPAPRSVSQEPRAAPPTLNPVLRAPATPHTRALARELHVDLATVKGTGPAGRITDDDVQRAAQPAARPAGPPPPPAAAVVAPAPRAAPPPTPGADEERVPVTHLRKVIAEAMAGSVQTAAHVTHVDEADVTELVAVQKRLKVSLSSSGERPLTLLPFFLKAVAATLRRHPKFNATLDLARGEMVLKRRVHLGFAVDTPEGLIVPVIRDVDQKPVTALSDEVADLAARARERRLTLEELRGGTCTVTNIGPVGGLFATPIIHQPELAIVGLHAIKDRPWVVDGAVVPRKVMCLSVTFDHRALDGAEGARFMNDLVRMVSDPAHFMVRI
jgi:pyruvate dehydrogenase E2 component (dihydrolipoamide acetyltransferase)